MSSQPSPTRFENYPPTRTEAPAGGGDREVPRVGPMVRPYSAPVVPGPAETSRRTLLGSVIAIPVVLVGISALRSSNDRSSGAEPSGWASSVAPGEEGPSGDAIAVGNYYATLPDGWATEDLADDGVEATNGANRLTAVSLEAAAASVAVEEITHLAKGRYAGFRGKLGEPVDHSSAEIQRASLAATGVYRDKPARLLVELWIDATGSGLLVARILTAKPNSTISAQAQQMVDELTQDL